MGYKLFMSGVLGNAGSVNASGNGYSLSIKQAAPGTFFSVLGAVIVCATIYKGLDFKSTLQEVNLLPPESTQQEPRPHQAEEPTLPDDILAD